MTLLAGLAPLVMFVSLLDLFFVAIVSVSLLLLAVSAVIITHRLLRIDGCRHHLCLVAHLCLAVRLCSFRFKGSWVPVPGCFALCAAEHS